MVFCTYIYKLLPYESLETWKKKKKKLGRDKNEQTKFEMIRFNLQAILDA